MIVTLLCDRTLEVEVHCQINGDIHYKLLVASHLKSSCITGQASSSQDNSKRKVTMEMYHMVTKNIMQEVGVRMGN